MKVGGRPGLPSLIVLMVSVDVKQHLKKAETPLTAIQDLPTVQNHLLSMNFGSLEARLVVHGRGKREKSSGISLKHVGATIQTVYVSGGATGRHADAQMAPDL